MAANLWWTYAMNQFGTKHQSIHSNLIHYSGTDGFLCTQTWPLTTVKALSLCIHCTLIKRKRPVSLAFKMNLDWRRSLIFTPLTAFKVNYSQRMKARRNIIKELRRENSKMNVITASGDPWWGWNVHGYVWPFLWQMWPHLYAEVVALHTNLNEHLHTNKTHANKRKMWVLFTCLPSVLEVNKSCYFRV